MVFPPPRRLWISLETLETLLFHEGAIFTFLRNPRGKKRRRRKERALIGCERPRGGRPRNRKYKENKRGPQKNFLLLSKEFFPLSLSFPFLFEIRKQKETEREREERAKLKDERSGDRVCPNRRATFCVGAPPTNREREE